MSQQGKEFKFSATPSSGKGYPVDVIAGSCVGNGLINYGHTETGWGFGTGNAPEVSGYKPEEAPDSIWIDYFSWVDNKFYTAVHPLPQQELYELLSTEYETPTGRTIRFFTFTVGCAPCGWVTVWLDGSAGSYEVCSFRAKEVDLDYNEVFPNRNLPKEEILQMRRKSMFSFVQQEIKENRVSSSYWEKLSKKYKWKLTLSDPEFEVYDYSVHFLNREIYSVGAFGSRLTELYDKSIPESIVINLRHNKDPLRYRVWINLAEEWPQGLDDSEREKEVVKQMTRNKELMDIFDRFYAEAGDEEVSLLVDLSDDMQSAELKLKTSTREQLIEGCRLYGIFDSDHVKIDY